MKIKTQDLIGPALDWGVAKCEGLTEFDCLFTAWVPVPGEEHFTKKFSPSTDWSQGGPVIDRIQGLNFKQWLESSEKSRCEAHINNYEGDWVEFGPTPLVAVMRCYVASKLGDEVDLPEELLK